MASSKIRSAIGAVKDHTSISLAKVSSFSDLEVAVVKATRHGSTPPDPTHAAEILNQTCYSRTMVRACVDIIARRLNRTKNWVVALKSLMLVQRLLAQGGPHFHYEIFFGVRRGTRFLNMCDFRDSTSRNGWDYSAFVRTYALYLDEALEFKMQLGNQDKGRDCYEEEWGAGGGSPSNALAVRETPAAEMDNEAIFSKADNLTHLLERFLACRPAGAAKHNRIVVVAIYPILKESFEVYHSITEILGVMVDRFMQMNIPDMEHVHHIFCRVSNHLDNLYSFYAWCKTEGIMRFPDYPAVEKISHHRLDMMDEFIRDKSAMLHRKKSISITPKLTYAKEEEAMIEPVKALPPLENALVEDTMNKVKENTQDSKRVQEEGDLLNLYGDETPTTEDLGDRLALALFDGYPATTDLATTAAPWEAFKDSSSGDWETALVQSASHLSNQKPSLPQGFDTLILDGMSQHQHGAGSSGFVNTGSASSVALPAAEGGNDPFAASLGVAPPAYVQMCDMEMRQRLLVQEQMLWQQYVRDGMHGQAGLAQLQQQNCYPYIQTGYAGAW